MTTLEFYQPFIDRNFGELDDDQKITVIKGAQRGYIRVNGLTGKIAWAFRGLLAQSKAIYGEVD